MASKTRETTTIIRTTIEGSPAKLTLYKAGPNSMDEAEVLEGDPRYAPLDQQMKRMQKENATSCTVDIPAGANNKATRMEIVGQGPEAVKAVASVVNIALLARGGSTNKPAGKAKCSRDVPLMRH